MLCSTCGHSLAAFKCELFPGFLISADTCDYYEATEPIVQCKDGFKERRETMKAVICDRCGKAVKEKEADKKMHGIVLHRENGFLTFDLCFGCYERYVGMVLDYIGKGTEE